ncbi:MAG: ABC transporter ATP-binding protein [Candidatus Nomurabacteria bacterium]|jgi:putative ABC transport system ATP-binding protein|nr:ABC transporter ATP-binding protein [Candidatus Nomurabacteria bacterium]
MALISAKNLGKTYGKKSNTFEALRKVNLEIKAGESVAIIGKSGSGKSTLMHLLALLDAPTSGIIKYNGKDVADLRSWEINDLRNEKFGFVFQQFFMNPRDTVLNNVILPLKIAGMDRRERKQRALDALAAVDLLDKVKARGINLSGGQKQRVCIARALVNNPEIIFADEPTGNLDSQTGKKIEDLLLKLNKTKNITLVVVTHDADLARRCKRRVYIKDGEIVDYQKRARKAAKTKTRKAAK